MNKYLKPNKKYLYILIGLTLIVRFLCFLFSRLAVGARWSSGLLLGGVDNWMDGGSLYTVQGDGMTPGSSYNPGSILLALVFRLIFGYGAETGIIICGAITMIFMLWGCSLLIVDNKKNLWDYIIISSICFLVEFPSAKSYLFEFHPDIPAVVCFLWGVICIDKYIQESKSIFAIESIVLLCLSGLFKQNAAFLFVGLGFFLFFTKKIGIKLRLIILLIELLAGLGVLAIMISIDGCWYNCVVVNSLHQLMSWEEYLSYIKTVVIADKYYILLLIVFSTLFIKGKVVALNLRERMWLVSALFWFLFCMYGAAKEGANDGNIEAAIIVFMPFTIKVVWKIGIYLLAWFNNLLKKGMGKSLCTYGYVFLLVICIVIIGKSSYNISKYSSDYRQRLCEQTKFSEWLSHNYSGRNIAYNTNNYELLNNSLINKKTDLYTSYVYSMGNLISDDKLSEISKKEKWDIIITIPAHGANVWPKTFLKFKKLNGDDYPSMFSNGEMIDVYIRK